MKSCYINNIREEELHPETIDMLLKQGYDVSNTTHNDGSCFTKAYWDKKASGKIRGDREQKIF